MSTNASRAVPPPQPKVGALIRARRRQLRMTLQALSDAATLELARNGDLGLIYAHLFSLGNVNRLMQRLPKAAS